MVEKQTEKIILTLLITIVVTVIVAVLSMMTMMSGYLWEAHGMWPMMMGRTGYWRWMPLGSLVFFIILIIGLYLVLSPLKKPEAVSAGAMKILKERYAKDELTSEQYHSMKKELET